MGLIKSIKFCLVKDVLFFKQKSKRIANNISLTNNINILLTNLQILDIVKIKLIKFQLINLSKQENKES
jgi:hypothetical protein